MLPPVADPSEFEIATVRCSHTNATLRIAQFGARALNKQYSDEAGLISRARIVEHQPSFKEPMEKGLRFTVISGALVLRCPGVCLNMCIYMYIYRCANKCTGLMKLLATSGNADHGTARQATTVQIAKRVLGIAKRQQSLDEVSWKTVLRIAALGMPQEVKDALPSQMGGFRRTPPQDDGGDDGRVRGMSRAVLALCTHAHMGMDGRVCEGSG